MKRLSFQWRITLVTATLVTVTCLILSFVISRFAVIQIDQIGEYMIEVTPFGSDGMVVKFDISQLFPKIFEQLQGSKTAFLYQSTIWVLAVVILTSIATYFLAGRMLSPLRRVTSKMEDIEAQNLSQPLEPPSAQDEIYQMVHSFNGMLARLDGAFSAQRQFSANAAHELRTPLAVMQTRLDVLYKNENISITDYEEVVQMLREQTGRLSHSVNLLLEMTELQTVERSDKIALHALVEEVFCDLAEIAEEKQISTLQTKNDCEIIGSDSLIYRAVYNLVENGIRYGKAPGSVTVDIKPNGNTVIIEVTDTGRGIDKSAWEDIFTPFFRTNKSRGRKVGGIGLGLALTKEIAEIHGGNVKVAGSCAEGTMIELTLPKRQMNPLNRSRNS